jgi:hypothetical protein
MNDWRMELWSTYEARGGLRIAPIAAPDDVRERKNVEGEHTISFVLPWDHPAVRPLGTEPADNFRRGQVVRFIPADPTAWTEHRIIRTIARQTARGKQRLITAQGIVQELATRGLVLRSQAGGHTPPTFEVLGLSLAGHVDDYILPTLEAAGQFFWERGIIENLQVVDLQYDRDTPLSALRKLAAAGGGLELSVTRTANGYAINLVRQIGAGDEPLIVQSRRNLIEMGFETSASEQATRIYAFGAGYAGKRAIIGDAEWEITGLASEAATPAIWFTVLSDPAGGAGPIQYDNQFVPPDPGEIGDEPALIERHYLRFLETATRLSYPIVQTEAATQRVYFEATTTLPETITATGDGVTRVRIEGDASGKRLAYVERPDAIHDPEIGVHTAVLAREDVPYTNNLLDNPLGRIWPANATVPSFWFGGAGLLITRETNPAYREYGEQAIRVRWNGGDVGAAVLRAPPLAIRADAQGFLSFFARLTVLTGRVRVVVALQRPTGAPVFTFVSGSSLLYIIPDWTGKFPGEEVIADLTNIGLGEPENVGLDAAWDLTKYPLYAGGSAEMYVLPGRDEAGVAIAPTEYILHGMQITNTQQNLPMLEGSGGTRLHQMANARLAIYSEPAESVSVAFADLSISELESFPYPSVREGRAIEVYNPDLGLALGTRITGYTRQWDRRLMPEVQLANARAGLTRLLTARQPIARPLPTLNASGTRGLTYEP